MANQTITQISRAGATDLDALAVAADAGLTDWWTGTGNEFLYVNNGGGSPITLTLQYNGPGGTIDGVALSNRTVSVGAGKRAIVGPFPGNLYTSQSTGRVTVGWSAVTSVKVAVLQWTPN